MFKSRMFNLEELTGPNLIKVEVFINFDAITNEDCPHLGQLDLAEEGWVGSLG